MNLPKIEVDGINLNYDASDGKEPTLLLIHGWTANMHRWDKIVEALGSYYKIIRVDLRGHGDSDKPNDVTYRLDDYVSDMVKFLESKELNQVVVAGHSMGGMIAQKLYFKVPDKIKGLILIGTTAKVVDGFAMKLNTSLALFLFKVAYNFTFKTVLSRAFSDLTPREERERLIREGLETVPPYVAVQSFSDFVKNFDMRNKLAEIDAPTLVMVGERDRMLPPRMSRYLADNIRNSIYVEIPEAGHEVMLEKPDEVVRAIDEFLHQFKSE